MGILDDALKKQGNKRPERLVNQSRLAKIASVKIQEGTFRGMDLIDGTAIVQLDGQPTATSGYRLITNAPLGDGDRVSIRPNGVALPRADARNVAPKADEAATVEPIFTNIDLRLLRVIAFGSDSFVDFVADTSSESGVSRLHSQIWNDKATKFLKWSRDITFPANTYTRSGTTYYNGVWLIQPPLFIDPNALFYRYSADKDWIYFEGNGVRGGTNALTSITFFADEATFPFIADFPSYEIVSPTSAIEVEFTSSLGGTLNIEWFVFGQGFFSFDIFDTGGSPISGYSFQFRYRKRVSSGDQLPWFQLV